MIFKEKETLMISEIRFIPIKDPHRGLVGFATFVYDGNIEIKDLAVHERLDKMGYRLVWPVNKIVDREIVRPINRQTTKAIDQAITDWINTHHPEVKNANTRTDRQ